MAYTQLNQAQKNRVMREFWESRLKTEQRLDKLPKWFRVFGWIAYRTIVYLSILAFFIWLFN